MYKILAFVKSAVLAAIAWRTAGARRERLTDSVRCRCTYPRKHGVVVVEDGMDKGIGGLRLP